MTATNIERLFFEGRYEHLLASMADAQTDWVNPFVVGALALSGRLDEAEITGRLIIRDEDRCVDEAVATRFFLCAGACHAGMPERATKWAKRNLGALRSTDPRNRFFAYQGLGLVRYFEGRMARSQRFTRRALSAAIEAGFVYGRLLALDLRGHALVQTGRIASGLRLLGQAERLALDVGFVANAQTIHVAELVYRVRHRVGYTKETQHGLEDLARLPNVSFFARRNAYLELAWQHAFQGRADLSAACLGEASRISLPDLDRRGRVRGLLAQTAHLILSQGELAATPYLEEAHRLAGPDASLRVEVSFVEAALMRTRRRGLADTIERLVRMTGIDRARIARNLLAPGTSSGRVDAEDRIGELLLELPTMTPASRLVYLVNEGLFGLVPWSLQLRPSCRVYLADTHLMTEDHGDVSTHEHPSGPSIRVLREIARGARTNAQLVQSVWNLGSYSPLRHDPTLHTAVARLRAALAPHGDWVVTTREGYRLAEDVEIVFVGESVESNQPSDDHAPFEEANKISVKESFILEIVQRRRQTSSAELAQDLRVSDATALRSLRTLVSDGRLQRTGRGRSTRYTLVPEPSSTEGDR